MNANTPDLNSLENQWLQKLREHALKNRSHFQLKVQRAETSSTTEFHFNQGKRVSFIYKKTGTHIELRNPELTIPYHEEFQQELDEITFKSIQQTSTDLKQMFSTSSADNVVGLDQKKAFEALKLCIDRLVGELPLSEFELRFQPYPHPKNLKAKVQLLRLRSKQVDLQVMFGGQTGPTSFKVLDHRGQNLAQGELTERQSEINELLADLLTGLF